MDIEQARLLTLKTAWMMDNVDAKEARAVDQKAKAQQVLGDIAAQKEGSLAELIASDDVRLRQTQHKPK